MNQNLPRLIWVLVAIVVLIGVVRLIQVSRHHRSNDQNILIEKSK